MTCQKFRLVHTVLFTLAALLAISPASIAQTQNTVEESAASTATAPKVTIFHFTDQGNDFPGRMTTDAAGNFYVSAELDSQVPFSHASPIAVLKYNFNGKLQGAFRYKIAPGEFGGTVQAVKVDRQGNIYAAGTTSFGVLVVRFTSAGVQRWADHFGNSEGNPVALAIDASGNIYAAGNKGHGGSDGVGPILEWDIVKYSSSGKVLWEQHHTGDPSLDSRVTDIQLDSAGNPIVFGTTGNNPANLTNNMTVVKLNPHGDTLWAKDFAVPTRLQQVPGGFAIDHGGNVYATSTPNPPEGIATPFTVKYDPNGVLKFVLQGKDAGGISVAVDPAGDILLTGEVLNFGTPTSIEATKIHPSGAKVWGTPIPATGKIVSDSTGNVFVAGSGFVITKLSPGGAVLFTASPLPGDTVTDAVVDPFGNLLATGFGQNAQFLDDIFTVRLK